MATETTWGNYGPSVRVLCVPAGPPSTDMKVQVKNATGGWDTLQTYNDMSDDYCYHNAGERARAARRSLVEGEAPC